MLDIKDLECFVVAYEAKSFSAAGHKLSTVQSNVSARVRRLEGTLDASLFQRKRYRLEPTVEGERLYQHAKHVLGLIAYSNEVVKGRSAA